MCVCVCFTIFNRCIMFVHIYIYIWGCMGGCYSVKYMIFSCLYFMNNLDNPYDLEYSNTWYYLYCYFYSDSANAFFGFLQMFRELKWTRVDYPNSVNHNRVRVLSNGKYSQFFVRVARIELETSCWFNLLSTSIIVCVMLGNFSEFMKTMNYNWLLFCAIFMNSANYF